MRHLRHRYEQRSVDALVPYARNARTHSPAQVKQIAASIDEFGFTNPVLVDGKDIIVAGHGRVMAAKRLGLSSVPVVVLEGLTEAQKRAYVLADNKIALNAGWDEALLRDELQDLAAEGVDLGLLGFSDAELTGIVPSAMVNRDPDLAPEAPQRAVTKAGDVWICGAHKVLCGDATSSEAADAVMAGELADVCWTDPPYNVAYEGRAGSIKNDDLKSVDFEKLLAGAFRCMASAMKPGAAIYVAHSDSEGIAFRSTFIAAGFKLAACLVWKKNQLVIGRSDYQWVHEPILYGWKEGAGHRWFGGRKQTTVAEAASDLPFVRLPDGQFQLEVGGAIFVVSGNATIKELLPTVMEFDKPRRSDLHPTMKPVALIERQVANNARRGDVAIDFFGGSGSTMIAAERLGLRARLIEMDPRFVDVIVDRWQEFTGEHAVRERDGLPFDEARNG